MIQEWFDENIFLYIILGICSIGILIKFILSMKYRLLIRASKRMGTSKNRLMRVLRLKFETCYKLNIGVNNVDTFVDKYVYRYRFCGILLYTWETISGEIIILSVLSGSIFSILGLLEKCGRNEILSTFIAGVLGALVLISYDHFVNLNMKRKVLKVNIRDYLENFLKSRLENGEFSSELLEQYRKEYMELPGQKRKKKDKRKENAKPLPGMVAQIESAATATELISVKEKIAEVKCEHVEDEFDDAKLFIHSEEVKEETVHLEEEDKKLAKKEKTKKKLKPEQEAELRREAKKNELKKMIQEDKENRHNIMPELFSPEPELEVVKDLKEKKDQKGQRKEEMKKVQSEKEKELSPFARPSDSNNKLKGNSNQKAISTEEAQIIEDILREYLA